MAYKDKTLYLDGPREYMPNVTYFHYPYVKEHNRAKARWQMSAEKGNTTSRDAYKRFMDIKWTNDTDVLKSKDVIEKLNGYEGFNVYKGEHPEDIREHPWFDVEDCRTIGDTK